MNPSFRTLEEQMSTKQLKAEVARLRQALEACAKGPQLTVVKGEYKTLHPEDIAKKVLNLR